MSVTETIHEIKFHQEIFVLPGASIVNTLKNEEKPLIAVEFLHKLFKSVAIYSAEIILRLLSDNFRPQVE